MNHDSRMQKTEEALDRWLRRMIRAANEVAKLRKKRKRLLKQPKRQPVSLPMCEPNLQSVTQQPREPIEGPVSNPRREPNQKPVSSVRCDLDIREQSWVKGREKDAEAATAIKEEIDARKKLKQVASAAKSKAKNKGELRKMPLTGKDALAAIRAL